MMMSNAIYFKFLMIWTWVAMFAVGMAVGYAGAVTFDKEAICATKESK